MIQKMHRVFNLVGFILISHIDQILVIGISSDSIANKAFAFSNIDASNYYSCELKHSHLNSSWRI